MSWMMTFLMARFVLANDMANVGGVGLAKDITVLVG